MIVPGYNESVRVGKVLFHVQTEHHEAPDKPYIETQVFRDGKIVLSRRFEKLRAGRGNRSSRVQQLREIHQGVVERLRRGPIRQDRTRQDRTQPGMMTRGIPSGDSELDRSVHDDINLRKLAIRLLRSVGHHAPNTDMRARLVAIGNIMALIGGQQTRHIMRRDDLKKMLRFRRDIVDLVRAPEIDLDRSLDLWRRLTAIALNMARVNDRRQLIEFDLELCRDFLAPLQGASSDQLLSFEEMRHLRPIWGRDAVLDAMLDEPAVLTRGAAAAELRRIRADLESQLLRIEAA